LQLPAPPSSDDCGWLRLRINRLCEGVPDAKKRKRYQQECLFAAEGFRLRARSGKKILWDCQLQATQEVSEVDRITANYDFNALKVEFTALFRSSMP
jgi:hypothetical protein